MKSSYTTTELRQASVRYQNRFPDNPPPTMGVLLYFIEREEREAREDVARRAREERERFVRVQFSGHGREYCYEVGPVDGAPPVRHGDYLTVWSPLTGRDEIVRVTALGRGAYRGGTKLAWRIAWAKLKAPVVVGVPSGPGQVGLDPEMVEQLFSRPGTNDWSQPDPGPQNGVPGPYEF